VEQEGGKRRKVEKEIQELNDYKELPRDESEHVHASTHIMSTSCSSENANAYRTHKVENDQTMREEKVTRHKKVHGHFDLIAGSAYD